MVSQLREWTQPLLQGNPVTREEGHATTGASPSSQKRVLEPKLHADDVKSKSRILPRDQRLGVVAVETGACGDMFEEKVVAAAIGQAARGVGNIRPEGTFSPSLGPRRLHYQTLVAAVQVVDHVVVVICSVVVYVSVIF